MWVLIHTEVGNRGERHMQKMGLMNSFSSLIFIGSRGVRKPKLGYA